MSVLPSRLPLLKKYTELLSKTCVLCQEIIRCTTSAIPVLFASKILSISRFFLPAIDATINGVIVTRFPPSSLITFDLRRDIYLPPDATSKLLKVAEKPMPRTHSLLDMSAHRNLSADFASIDDDDALSDDADSKSRETVIDFSRDTILPSSETPSPSPIPLFAPNSFSPIPKSSPSLDGMSEMDELDEVNVPEVSEKEVCSHSLRVKDYRRTIDRVCLRSRQDPANRARHDAMVAAFPTLFFWREVVGEVAVPGLEGEVWWRERYFFPPSVHRSLSMCDGLLFDLIRSWFEFLTVYQARYHAHHAAEPFFAFDLFPLYFLQIHALLPSVHHSILQQLSCGLARRQGQPTPTEYIKSGMKARWPQGLEFTRSCFLLSSPNWATQLVEMILCHCNVFVVTDVNICRGWGIPRFCSPRRLQVSRSVDGRTAESAFSLHPNAFAANHRGRTGEMCFSRHQHDDQKRGDFAPSVEEWALAGTLTNQITWRTRKRESTCGTHSLRKAF